MRDREHRAEDLLTCRRRARSDPIEDRRTQEETGPLQPSILTTVDHRLGTFIEAALQVGQHTPAMLISYERTKIHSAMLSGSDFERPCLRFEPLHHYGAAASHGNRYAARKASLTCIAEGRVEIAGTT
jgi:hypothetical protein